ncbi:extracellular solute-binding protein [Nakamurella antarctica]|uniref:Extracellular solute-binding protein n=1 Tax=Nakamurella antarctica TaxID=1902245 RepID=A0A3G8ZIC7_9ACTN|nr:extracellular solute-binding protein [Nakamurella antarctica]AZI56928.1 extracellular solute-binding protein [Nakamurella antarctica]
MTRLRIAYRAFDGFQRALERQASTFALPGVEIEAVAMDPPSLSLLLLDSGALASDGWDVVMVLTDWIPQLVAAGSLRALDSWLEKDTLTDWPGDFHDGVRRLAVGPDGRTYALPYHDGPQALVYRCDLFSDPVEQRMFVTRFGYPLQVPTTWRQFLDVATHFTRPEENLAGCVMAGFPDAHNTVYDFFIHLWGHGGEILGTDGPMFDSDAGVIALSWLRDLMRSGSTQSDPLDTDSVAAGEVFAAGGAAMMWNWLGFAVTAELDGSPIQGRVGVAPMPAVSDPPGPTLSLYWTLAIPVGARDPDLSWQFLEHVAQPAGDKITAEAGAVAVRLSSWNSSDLHKKFGAYRVIESAHDHARNLPATRYYPAISEALNTAIDNVYRHDADPAAELAIAANLVRIAMQSEVPS